LSAPGLHTPEPSREGPSPEPAALTKKDATIHTETTEPDPSETAAVMTIGTTPAVTPLKAHVSPDGQSLEPASIPASAHGETTKHMVGLEDLEDFRRLMARATTADECRLLLDMFMLRSGVALFPSDTEFAVPYPSPVASDGAYMPLPSAPIDDGCSPTEASLVELLLGSHSDNELGNDAEKLISDFGQENTSVPSTPVYKLHADAYGPDDDDVSSFASEDSSPVMSPVPDTSAI
jgi:hypothetical protein